jgi:hypothetical protein
MSAPLIKDTVKLEWVTLSPTILYQFRFKMGNFEIFGKLTFYGLLHGLGLLLATYWIGWIVYTRVFHPLARFPGPFWASVSRAWIVRSVIRGNPHETQRLLHAKYGAIFSTFKPVLF